MKQYLKFLTRLRNRYLMAFDFIGLAVIPSIALVIRTDDLTMVDALSNALLLYSCVMLGVKLVSYYATGLYGQFWGYASVPEMVVLLSSLAAGSALEMAMFYGLFYPFQLVPGLLPRSIPIISALLTGFWIGGIRMGIRIAFMLASRGEGTVKPHRVIIVGAGAAGTMTAKELKGNMQLGILPVGFVDDDRLKQGRNMCGIPVCGTLAELPEVLAYMNASEVIIAMPTASGKVIRNVVQSCRDAHVPYKTIPALYDIIRGTAKVKEVRDVQLEDLLRRETVSVDTTPVMLMLTGSRVLVTGAGGSIGGELCRQIASFRPAEIILLGHGEASIFHIMKELGEFAIDDIKITPVIADIRDRERMEKVFARLHPDVVFHAAAHKHVYLMQENIPEAVSNNVLGTRNLVELSDRFGVRRFVMVSSDKSVNPTSVMGVTKRIAELIVQDVARRSKKAFVTVRFGNVLGSRGSVVPLFKRQIAMGGPVTVTDPDVTRFFMTIPEAVHLILQAATMGESGEVFVLDMGEQIKVIDIAHDLIRLSGYTKDDIEIKITGLVPGEKMYEELFYESDHAGPTQHPKIMMCRPKESHEDTASPAHESRMQMMVSTLIEAAQQESMTVITGLFHKLVPQYMPTYYAKPAKPTSVPEGETAVTRAIRPTGPATVEMVAGSTTSPVSKGGNGHDVVPVKGNNVDTIAQK
jgi:FlaA1/EpsC-like NDP-sugar epimerase